MSFCHHLHISGGREFCIFFENLAEVLGVIAEADFLRYRVGCIHIFIQQQLFCFPDAEFRQIGGKFTACLADSRIIFPLMVPAMITGSIFSFMWRWDDFLGALLYVNKTERYPVSLALKMFCDPSSSSDYGAMFAMATLSILPAVIIFFCLQKYLVEGISTSGLKG